VTFRPLDQSNFAPEVPLAASAVARPCSARLPVGCWCWHYARLFYSKITHWWAIEE